MAMSFEQYKAARIWFGLNVNDWTRMLGISKSLHWQLTGGFIDVSKQTEAHINTLMRLVKTRRELSELNNLIDYSGVREQLYRF